MIGLNRENAGRRAQNGLAGDERSGSVIGRDSYILEDIGSDQEGSIAGEGIEGLEGGGDSSSGSECIPGSRGTVSGATGEVDLRLSDGERTESRAQVGDVLTLFDGSFNRVGLDRGQSERNRGAGLGKNHALGADSGNSHYCRAGSGGRSVSGVDVGAEGGEVVEVGLEILKVEGEVEDVVIGVGSDGGKLRQRPWAWRGLRERLRLRPAERVCWQ